MTTRSPKYFEQFQVNLRGAPSDYNYRSADDLSVTTGSSNRSRGGSPSIVSGTTDGDALAGDGFLTSPTFGRGKVNLPGGTSPLQNPLIQAGDLPKTSGDEFVELLDGLYVEKPSKSGACDQLRDVLGPIFNFITTILGPGMVGLPYAMRSAGLITGVCLMSIVAFVMAWTARVMIICCEKVGVRTYEDLCEKAWGKIGFWTMSVSAILVNFGGCLSSLVIVGDNTGSAITEYCTTSTCELIAAREIMIPLISILLILPRTLSSDVSDLVLGAVLNAFCGLGILGIMMAKAVNDRGFSPSGGPTGHSDPGFHLFINPPGVLSAMGTMSFVYCTQGAWFPIKHSLRDQSKAQWYLVSWTALSICFVVTTLVAVSGYITFQEQTDGDVLQNFTASSSVWQPIVETARFLVILLNIFYYPMALFVVRTYLLAAVTQNSREPTKVEFYGYSALIFISNVVLAMTGLDLGIVMGLFGAVAASFIGFILPSVCYLKIFGMRAKSCDHVIAWITLLFGVAMLFVGTVTTLLPSPT